MVPEKVSTLPKMSLNVGFEFLWQDRICLYLCKSVSTLQGRFIKIVHCFNVNCSFIMLEINLKGYLL